ncbi:MAG: heavy metal-binding domain-containing protein [Bacteroidales bacterium]
MKNQLRYILDNYKLVIVILITGIILGWMLFHNGAAHSVEQDDHSVASNDVHIAGEIQIWTCSMHPQIKQEKPGKCPICAMDLHTASIDEQW